MYSYKDRKKNNKRNKNRTDLTGKQAALNRLIQFQRPRGKVR